MVKSIRLAFSFLTVLPMGKISTAEGDWHRAAVFFPLVGGVLGALLAAGGVLGHGIAPPPLLSALALAAQFLLTRGLHTDGLSDTVDGLIGGMDRELSLKIMLSGAAGPMGVAVVILTLMIKFSALVSLPASLPLMLFFAPLCGRWCVVLAGAAFKPARREGLGSAFITSLNWRHLGLSTLMAGVIALCGARFLGYSIPLLAMATAVTVAFGAAAAMARRLGGLTGDTLGAVNEIAETVFLTAFVLSDGAFTAAP
jgi:cobalamin 5'-phosphate synthase/cobalamin synthase